MEFIWYSLVVLMLAAYFVLDGYDFGSGMIQLFFSRSEKETTTIYKAIGPFWNANEVWLIAGGGTLFCTFPLVYASSFSGFYLPLIMVLWLLIFRGISMELRHQVNSQVWYSIWDKAFGISSLLLALFFGVALGNVIRGVNLGMVENGALTQEKNFFFLPLWNESFSPLETFPGVLDWFTVIIGIIAVVTLCIHGANWIIFKTNSSMNVRLKKIVPRLAILLSVLVVISLIIIPNVRPDIFDNYINHPWLFILPVICLVGLIGLFGVNRYKRDGKGFFFSILFLVGGLASSVASIFPELLHSTNELNPSLTIYNAAADSYSLSSAIVWWPIAIVPIIIYFIIQYRVFRGKMDEIKEIDY